MMAPIGNNYNIPQKYFKFIFLTFCLGLGYDQIKDKLPHAIDVACRNKATSCKISGSVEASTSSCHN